LHLIRSDHGVGLSNQVARRLVAAAYRSAGQAQYVPRSVPDPLGDDFADTREWALQHIGEKLTLRDLAANAGVSVRTFSRRFVEDTGYTPMQWVLRARVDLARELLEDSDLGIEQIADQVGLGTGANLRMHFHRVLSTSPTDYRHSCQGSSERARQGRGGHSCRGWGRHPRRGRAGALRGRLAHGSARSGGDHDHTGLKLSISGNK